LNQAPPRRRKQKNQPSPAILLLLRLRAVAGVSTSLQQGCIHELIGPNRAGKTTLINAIMGLVPHEEGKILLQGAELEHLPSHRIAARGIGRTFQHAELFADQTVLDNILQVDMHSADRIFCRTCLVLPRKLRQNDRRGVTPNSCWSASGFCISMIGSPAICSSAH
jgi:ABC-type branched-subunit amino acid transport system ATPase component